MNARFYVPNTNRMLTPDSIIPDPTNPQSYNRYSYAYNNPVNSIDPTGHEPVCHSNGCSNLVKFDTKVDTVTWTDAEMQVVINSATDVALALLNIAPEGKYADAEEAFLDNYGEAVWFVKSGESLGYWGQTFHEVEYVNGERISLGHKHEVRVHEDVDFLIEDGWQFTVHELGHAFSHNTPFSVSALEITQAFGNFPNRPMNSEADGTWGFASGRYGWQQSPRGNPSEELADMFLGWVYNQWEPSESGSGWSSDGQKRANWMNLHMSSWVATR